MAEQVVARILIDLRDSDLRASSTNPRRTFDRSGIEELKASIAQLGIQEPLLVRPIRVSIEEFDGLVHYEVVSGHRRLLAARELGLDLLPCMVAAGMTDAEAAETALVANLQRVDIHPMEEAEAYGLLIADSAAHGFGADRTAEDIAKRVGKTVAHVAQVLKLRELIAVASEIFADNHITLGHALHLAKLTAVDQDRATRWMLNGTGDFAKLGTEELLAARLKNIATSKYAANKRLIDETEGELKAWIAENVLLQLGKAPWALEDALLLPSAGACTTCPQRSGSNVALFADLTPDQDVCLAPACYAAKHKAFVSRVQLRATEAGEPLLKLSTKHSGKKLPETITEKLVFKSGQWVEAKPKSCPAVRKGILLDSASVWNQAKRSEGDILSVCVNQGCKVHKHTVDADAAKGGNGKPQDETYEMRQKREAEETALIATVEIPVLRAVYDTMRVKVTPTSGLLQTLVSNATLEQDASRMCVELGIDYGAPKTGIPGDYQHNEKAEAPLAAFIGTASLAQLHLVAFHALLIDELHPAAWSLRERKADVRTKLWKVAKHLGVDADAIAKRVEAELGAARPVEAKAAPKKVVVKPAPKKASVRKVPAKPAAKKTLSPEARTRIADETKKCWAERQKAKTPGAQVPA